MLEGSHSALRAFDDLGPRQPGSGRIHVVIETPAGSQNKYKYDRTIGVLRLSRVLPVGMVFPFNFGSIPGTCAEDGDALDVLVIDLPPTFAGCLVTARLIGVLRAWQMEKRKRINNDRLIAIAETPVNPARIRNLKEIAPRLLHELEHFLESYNRAQGRKFRITARAGRHVAEALLSRGIRQFARQASG
jgi:inorganic pyrophosphatase